MNGMDGAAKM